MSNPWLNIPLDEYETHMSSPAVGQSSVLSELFGYVLGRCAPRSVAVLGVAGGNGLERINPAHTTRICGVDVNPDYLRATGQRFGNLSGLELHCIDLSKNAMDVGHFDLVHAALIVEHAGLGCLENISSVVSERGALSVVLQLPSREQTEAITADSVPSIQSLRDHFCLIAPSDLQNRLKRSGFYLSQEMERDVPGGKAFWMGIFLRE